MLNLLLLHSQPGAKATEDPRLVADAQVETGCGIEGSRGLGEASLSSVCWGSRSLGKEEESQDSQKAFGEGRERFCGVFFCFVFNEINFS